MKLDKAVVVYQRGLANVFEVKAFNMDPYGRDAKRLYQGSFISCEIFAHGLAAAGVVIRSAACNLPGDISSVLWTDDLESLPFVSHFNPVNEN